MTLLPYHQLTDFTTEVFQAQGVPEDRARTAAEALVYGDLVGMRSHGLANLTRLYLPLFTSGRVAPAAEPEVLADRGATVLLDSRKGLGLWAAAEAMDLAAERAGQYGIGMVSVRDATHLGCAGFHAARAVENGMIGLVASNCGRQRIARPPGGRVAMLGTNPLAAAAPAGPGQAPFVLDMSTTVAPTGKVREAARAYRSIPEGWLQDAEGRWVTDPHALDCGEGFPLFLGGHPETGGYKGYGLALLVEVLAALVPGAGLGPDPEAYSGTGGPSGRDDDIGFFVLAVAPGTLRPEEDFTRQAAGLFAALTGSPTLPGTDKVAYPGCREADLKAAALAEGVPVADALLGELRSVADDLGLKLPEGDRNDR